MKHIYKAKNGLRAIKVLSVIIVFFLSSQKGFAQEPFKLSSGENVLSIGGIVSSYLDLRTYPAGITANRAKNTFKLKDARLDLNGKFGKDLEFHLQLDMAGWGAVYDPANPLIDDAHFTYKGIKKLFNIRFGYGKVPYSLNSMIDHEWTPYWERPQITKGDFFSRRDLGLRLDRSFWNDRIKAYAGMYTGVGEVVLGGSNDPSGAFEYIGRLEAGYPERRSDQDAIIDTKVSKTPNIQVGVNGRYSNRRLPVGDTFLAGEEGALVDSPYNFKVVDGKKYIYGVDVSAEYAGFSIQAETHILKGMPQNETDPLFAGTTKSANKSYFRAGGWYATANYFAKPIKSILSVRYEELNANDLIPGTSKRLAASYSYQVKGFHSMIRVEFDRILKQTESINNSSWNNEFKVGWQFVIE